MRSRRFKWKIMLPRDEADSSVHQSVPSCRSHPLTSFLTSSLSSAHHFSDSRQLCSVRLYIYSLGLMLCACGVCVVVDPVLWSSAVFTNPVNSPAFLLAEERLDYGSLRNIHVIPSEIKTDIMAPLTAAVPCNQCREGYFSNVFHYRSQITCPKM